MHFYQHNIPDFNNATRHLTRIERSIYRDLIEVYYDNEGPLSLDIAMLCRKVIARTEEEKAAVLGILDEFFTRSEEGYRHDRCDKELENAVIAMHESEDRRKNEKERQRQHRERRSELFSKLREFNDIPAWNTSTEVLLSRLETHLSRVTGRDETCTQHVQNTPATATQYPIPNTQYPIPNIEKEAPSGEPIQKIKKRIIALPEYLTQCKTEGKQAIPEGHAVFEYANSAKIPEDFLRLQWLEFRDRYSEQGAKTYASWPTVFSKSVRGNWFKLWHFDKDGHCALSTTGIQAKNTHEARK